MKTTDADEMTTATQNSFRVHGIHVCIGAMLLVAVLVWLLGSVPLEALVDIPSLLLVGGLTTAGLWMGFGPMRSIEAIGKGLIAWRETDPAKLDLHLCVLARASRLAWSAGVLGTILNAIAVLIFMTDPHAVSGFTGVLIPLLYGTVLAHFIFGMMRQTLISRSGC